jgi:hypothetical protein
VQLSVHSISASKCISKLARSWPQSVSLSCRLVARSWPPSILLRSDGGCTEIQG